MSKSKKHKKKKPGLKPKLNGDTEKTNGTRDEVETGLAEEDLEEPETPTDGARPRESFDEPAPNGIKSPTTNGTFPKSIEPCAESIVSREEPPTLDGSANSRSRRTTINEPQREIEPPNNSEDTETRLDALANERAILRDEVAQLRKSLENLQEKHQADLGTIIERLEDTRIEKDHAETQYRNLLGKVNTIRSQLGERLKADAASIAIHSHRLLLTLCRRICHKLEPVSKI